MAQYLVEVPHVESTLVAMSKDWLSVWTEQAANKAKISSAHLAYSHLWEYESTANN